MNELQRIQIWYTSQCNEDWEHSYGITIDTLDNPGWLVKIDIVETELEQKVFERTHRGNSEEETDWTDCKVESGKYIAAGGSGNLVELLDTFLKWAEV